MIAEKVFNPKLAPDFQVILDATSDLIWAFDKDYNLAYCNKSFANNFELFLHEKIDENKSLNEYEEIERFKDFSAKWNEWYKKAFSGEHFHDSIEYKIAGKNLYYSLEFTPVSKRGEVAYVQISARENTVKNSYNHLLTQSAKCEECEYKKNSNKDDIVKERDQAISLLMNNAERLQMVFEGSSDGFWDWNLEKDDIFHSRNYYEIFGFRNGELKSDLKTWEKRIHPDDLDRVLQDLNDHLDGKTNQYYSEYRVLTKLGEWKWVLDKGKVAIRDENNNPLRVAGTLSDISERKKTEKDLRLTKYTVDKSALLIFWYNKEAKFFYANEAACDKLGYSKEEFLQIGLENIDPNWTQEYWENERLANIGKNKVETFEAVMRKKNGETFPVEVIASDFNYEGEEIFVGFATDITERKEAEHRLLESEKQFNEITSVLAEGLFVIDNNWNLMFVNPEFENLLGYSLEDLKGKKLHEIIHNHDEENNQNCAIENVLTEGETIRVPQDFFRRKDGELIPVSYVSSPIKRDGKITGCVTALHDISERLQAEEDLSRFVEELQYNKELVEENANQFVELNQQLEESQQRLEDLNASKDKFFSIISHDLRSPFTSIIGFSEVMLEDVDSLSKEDIKDFASSIYKSSKNIQNLLENLLQWSRVQTGRIEFNPHTFVLNNIANDIVALYQVNAARKKINLFTDLDDEIKLFADQFMIDTIIRNLVSNSIKFTKAGGEIKISSELKENEIEITISDTGVGMNEEIKNKLFKIDEHVTTRGTEKEKGTGIGLILCKEFVEKHDGKIWVESVVGEGSQFKFTIPIKEN